MKLPANASNLPAEKDHQQAEDRIESLFEKMDRSYLHRDDHTNSALKHPIKDFDM